MSDVRYVLEGDVEAEGLITIKECAELAKITTLTATKRLTAVKLMGKGVAPVAYMKTEKVGRPPRLFPRQEALEACMNSVGDRKAQGEKETPMGEYPAAVETDAILSAIA